MNESACMKESQNPNIVLEIKDLNVEKNKEGKHKRKLKLIQGMEIKVNNKC